MRNSLKLSLAVVCAMSIANGADEPKEKRTLQGNMNEVYNLKPQNAESLAEAFGEKSMFYGRVRMNLFQWDRTDPSNSNTDEKVYGKAYGGSLIYKTAPLYGVSTTLGFYTSQAFGLDDADVLYGKSGKDTFSRKRVDLNKDKKYVIGEDSFEASDMNVLAQAYIQYNVAKTEVRAGRMLHESILTASNDTKMIPNGFEGIDVVSKDLPATKINLALFTSQKLRDHTEYHDLMMVSGWSENDDSGVHNGLTKTNMQKAGLDGTDYLGIIAISNESIKNLKLDLQNFYVPDLMNTTIVEANYKIPMGDVTITPGFRYLNQQDDQMGAIGGASITGKSAGYSDPTSADGSLWAARLVGVYGASKLTFGYSSVADDADIVAPWRGFPTGGYTRSMTEVNWNANTQSFMISYNFNFGKAKLVKGLDVTLNYAENDRDEAKQANSKATFTDTTTYHADIAYKVPTVAGLYFKLRMMQHDGYGESDFTDNRFEINYLF